jgi:hypothetical protein
MKSIINFLIKYSPRVFKSFFKRIKLMIGLFTVPESYLISTGYIDSFLYRSLKDSNGENLPWMNYPIISFLKDKLHKDISVFEYGSGASTLFFAKRTASVTSIEYDKEWYKTIVNEISDRQNALIHFQSHNEDYSKSIENFGKGEKFDLIVIDGRDRVKCAINAFPFLSDKGVLIFDDTQRERYHSGLKFY